MLCCDWFSWVLVVMVLEFEGSFFEFEKVCLFCIYLFWILGDFDLGDLFVFFDLIGVGIGYYCI